jgi:hypothetical protein
MSHTGLSALRPSPGLSFSLSYTWSGARVPWASWTSTTPLNKRTTSCRSLTLVYALVCCVYFHFHFLQSCFPDPTLRWRPCQPLKTRSRPAAQLGRRCWRCKLQTAAMARRKATKFPISTAVWAPPGSLQWHEVALQWPKCTQCSAQHQQQAQQWRVQGTYCGGWRRCACLDAKTRFLYGGWGTSQYHL